MAVRVGTIGRGGSAGGWSAWLAALGTGPVWVALALFPPFFLPASLPVRSPDIWWTLKSGELIARGYGLLDHDPFTTAPLDPAAINQQWLAQLVYYGVYALGGLAGVSLFNGLAVLAACVLLLVLSYRRSGSVRLAAVSVLLGFWLVASNLNPRPQTLAFVLFLSLYALLDAGVGLRWLWLALPIQVLWANLHGSFWLGPLLASLFAVGRALDAWRDGAPLRSLGRRPEVWRAAALVPALALATLLNPHGVGLWGYAARLTSNPIIRQYVTEWWPTSFAQPTGVVFFASLLLVGGTLYLSRRRLALSDALLLVAFAILALQAVRSVVWWGWVATPILAAHLPYLPVPRTLALRVRTANARPAPAAPWLNLLTPALLVLLGLTALPGVRAHNPLLPAERRAAIGTEEPVAVAEWLLRSGPPGRLFNAQGWGGYLDWALWPRYRVFVDGRVEIHPPEVWLDYLRISSGHATWEELLARYGLDLLVLSVAEQPELVPLVDTSPNWRLLYADATARIYQRAGS